MTHNHQSGFVLLSVLVLIMLSSFVLLIFFSNLHNAQKLLQHNQINAEIDTARQACLATVVEILSKRPANLLQQSVGVFSAWQHCPQMNDRIIDYRWQLLAKQDNTQDQQKMWIGIETRFVAPHHTRIWQVPVVWFLSVKNVY